VLEPVVARYRGRGLALYFRGDAAFAKPEVYELLEAEGVGYAVRLPANAVLQGRIGHLLTRPVGRPPKRPRVFHTSFGSGVQRLLAPGIHCRYAFRLTKGRQRSSFLGAKPSPSGECRLKRPLQGSGQCPTRMYQSQPLYIDDCQI
jgi:hypothetical protein